MNRNVLFVLSTISFAIISIGLQAQTPAISEEAMQRKGFQEVLNSDFPFKLNHVKELTPWAVLEAEKSMPWLAYPAMVGSGKMTIGVDAAGLQSFPDHLMPEFKSKARISNTRQCDLYVLHEGMISEHLLRDEANLYGITLAKGELKYGTQKNFMPLGYLTQSFTCGETTYKGDDVYPVSTDWKRDWNLRHGLVSTSYRIEGNIGISVEIFMPSGKETAYIKLIRAAVPDDKRSFTWSVSLPLSTRTGLVIYDEPNSVSVKPETILASITTDSIYRPNEPYKVVYGVAADGMNVHTSQSGWEAVMTGKLSEEQTAYLRLDFQRYAGDECEKATTERDALTAALKNFDKAQYSTMRTRHSSDFEVFWEDVADISVKNPDRFDKLKHFMLHMSQYLFRCGSDFSFGGTAQFCFFHGNGWAGSNFHDSHYTVDGLQKTNRWKEALASARWLKKVMRTSGRAFPWMMNYDGFNTTSGLDQAPMSDSMRALQAAKVYEHAGEDKKELLQEVVYPIVKRVSDMALEDWFIEENGRLILKGVELDVMGQETTRHESATVMQFAAIMRKAISYSKLLDIDAERREVWERAVEKMWIDTVDGKYVAYLNAPVDAKASCWFCHGYYGGEFQPLLDDEIFKKTVDRDHQYVACNFPWIALATACSEMRLGRPDRAEQYFVDSIESFTNGPGYFDEATPAGSYAVPPFASAHGSHLVAACEQIVISDFWQHRVYIGKGMPSKMRASEVTFNNLRGRDGIVVSGNSSPKSLVVNIHHTGDPVEMDVVLSLPCECSTMFKVYRDSIPVPYEFNGETITVHLELGKGDFAELRIVGKSEDWF